MKKNLTCLSFFGDWEKNRQWLMRLTVLKMILLMSLLTSYGNVNSQMIISKLKLESVELSKALEQVEDLTEYDFVFSYDDVEGYKVTVDLESRTLEESMAEILKDLPFEYQTEGDVVIVSYKKLEPIIEEQQEKKTLKGKVTDEKGSPLPGVSIIIKNTYVGVSTNIDGEYVMSGLEPDVTLLFSSIGFVSQEILFEGQKELDVKMVPDMAKLSEVVVTGYFKQAKESFTGSAVTMDSEQLLQVGNQNILQSIQLIDPSFMLVDNALEGSNPNAMPDFQIRGNASVDMRNEYEGNPNTPTFILDGFEVNIEKIYDLDPYRVRSVTILKDAAATAIYGSRAANGVVVVETFAPEGGKMVASYKGDFTFSVADLSDYDLLNAQEKFDLEVASGLFQYSSGAMPSYIEGINRIYNEKLKQVQQGYNTYWLNKPIEKLAVSHKHSLLLEGGTDEIRYGIDVNYSDQNGIMKESGRDRMGLGLKLQYTYNNLTIRNKLTYDNVRATNSPYGNFSSYAKMNPYYRYTNDLGEYEYILEKFENTTVYNPLYNTTLNTIDENRYDNMVNNFDIDWRINSDLRLKASLSVDKRIGSFDNFKPGSHTSFASQADINKKGHYIASRDERVKLGTNVVLNYFKKSNKHVINANGIFNARQESLDGLSLKAEGFPNEDMDNINFAIQYEANGSPNGVEYTSRLLGVSGNLNYSYDSKYLIDLSGRMDGSSSFGADKRWAPFWAIGTGWNLHYENFLKNSSLINKLKLRGSYGSTGSVGFNPYQAMMMYNYLTDPLHRFETGATMIALGNESLAWQQTIKRNIGLDFVMFNSRLSGNANYYNDLTKGLLVDITLAPSLGFSQFKDNLGETKNEGFELALRYNILKKNKNGINWSVFGNAVHNKNTLLKLSDSLDEFNANQDAGSSGSQASSTRPRVRYIEGQSMNAIWANKSLGIDPNTGREIFVTKDRGTSLEWDTENYKVCGNSAPDWFGTFGSNFSFKGFLLNFVFKYRLGGDYYNQTLVDRVENANPRFNTDRRVLEERWKNPGDMSFYKNIKDESYTKPTSRFIQKYSYLQFATINASYEFDSSVAKKIGMKRLKMLFYMNDIFTTSTVRAERGINYPYQRNFSLGIQAQF